MMYTCLLISLFILPMFYAEPHQLKSDDHREMFIPRSGAASYLFAVPDGRFRDQVLRTSLDSSMDSNDFQPPQRAKRIYWENLAFHAADFNQKGKKV